jgi:hypothetical protein
MVRNVRVDPPKSRNDPTDILYISQISIRWSHFTLCNVIKFHASPTIVSDNTANLYLQTSASYANIELKYKIYTVMTLTYKQVSWLSKLDL